MGLTWDGSSRKLSVDGADVAKDKPDGCGNSPGGLNFAVGKNLDTGTYWSGLIDGVRIYGRAAKSAGK